MKKAGRPRPMEVWNAHLYFDDGSGAKNRPVIVLEKHGDAFTVLMVTTHGRSAATDFKLFDPYEVMLDQRSVVRTDRLFKLKEDEFNYKLGDLCPEDVDMMTIVLGKHKGTKAYKKNDYRGDF